MIKDHKFDELERYILSDKNLDLDIKDDNFNYFINYAINLIKLNLLN